MSPNKPIAVAEGTRVVQGEPLSFMSWVKLVVELIREGEGTVTVQNIHCTGMCMKSGTG